MSDQRTSNTGPNAYHIGYSEKTTAHIDNHVIASSFYEHRDHLVFIMRDFTPWKRTLFLEQYFGVELFNRPDAPETQLMDQEKPHSNE